MEISDVRSCALVGPRLSWPWCSSRSCSPGALLGVRGDGRGRRQRDRPTCRTTPSPRSAARLQAAALDAREYTPAIVVYDRGGEPLTAADRRAVAAQVRELARARRGPGSGCSRVFAEDGQAAFLAVPIAADIAGAAARRAGGDDPGRRRGGTARRPARARHRRAGVHRRPLGGLRRRRRPLLLTTAGVVALLLLITYRSPWLWLVPLTVVGRRRPGGRAAAGRRRPTCSGSPSTGRPPASPPCWSSAPAPTTRCCSSPATARSCAARTDRYDAMRVALRRAAPAIVASSGTVVAGPALPAASRTNPSSRRLGFGGAIGIVTAVVFALLVLPGRAARLRARAVLAVRAPRRAARADRDRRSGPRWRRVVTSRPRLVSVVGVLVLVALALPLAGVSTGLSQTEQFRAEPEAVVGPAGARRALPGRRVPAHHRARPGRQRRRRVRRAVAGVDGRAAGRAEAGGDADHGRARASCSAPTPARGRRSTRSGRSATPRASADAGALVGGADARGARRQGAPRSTTSGW